MQINNISSLGNMYSQRSLDKSNLSNNSFSDILSQKLDDMSTQESNYNTMKTEYIEGKRDDIQNILIEGEKTSLGLSYALQIRNNLVSAFQELSKMQI